MLFRSGGADEGDGRRARVTATAVSPYVGDDGLHDNGPGEGGPKVGCPGREEKEGKEREGAGLGPDYGFFQILKILLLTEFEKRKRLDKAKVKLGF